MIFGEYDGNMNCFKETHGGYTARKMIWKRENQMYKSYLSTFTDVCLHDNIR